MLKTSCESEWTRLDLLQYPSIIQIITNWKTKENFEIMSSLLQKVRVRKYFSNYHSG